MQIDPGLSRCQQRGVQVRWFDNLLLQRLQLQRARDRSDHTYRSLLSISTGRSKRKREKIAKWKFTQREYSGVERGHLNDRNLHFRLLQDEEHDQAQYSRCNDQYPAEETSGRKKERKEKKA